MTYDDFSSKIHLFGDTMSAIYQEHLNGVFTNFYVVAVLLSNDFYDNAYLSFETYVNTIIDERKLVLNNQIADIQGYVTEVSANGITDYTSTNYDAFASYDITPEIINIYRLKYVLNYYRLVLDSNDVNSWIYNPVKYDEFNTDFYQYFNLQTAQLFSELTV